VYPRDVKDVPPLVARLCEALHTLPRVRWAECCQSTPGTVLTSECTRNVTGAIAGGAIALSEDGVARCEAAMAKVHEGCDWVGPWPRETPAECRSLFRGSRKANDACRSTLECEGSLRCLGVGPTDAGRCGEPPPIGGLCGSAVDALAVYARQDDVDEVHPMCGGGYCDRNRCAPHVELGGKCTASVQCGEGRCVEGACVADRRGAVGEPCSGGDCQAGLRCVSRACVSPKAAGETCTDDRDCLGGCVGGVCKMTCESPAIRRGLIQIPNR
jgi:hypothetical protein